MSSTLYLNAFHSQFSEMAVDKLYILRYRTQLYFILRCDHGIAKKKKKQSGMYSKMLVFSPTSTWSTPSWNLSALTSPSKEKQEQQRIKWGRNRDVFRPAHEKNSNETCMLYLYTVSIFLECCNCNNICINLKVFWDYI